ncbi:MAG: hypothetical protein ACYCYM_09755 [Saccharofermentanales bacterium]
MSNREKREILLAYLTEHHRCRADAISGKDLEEVLGSSSREIRRMVNRLRSEAYPICSDAGGYYYSHLCSDVDETIAHLKQQIASMSNAIDGLLKASGALEALDLVTIEVRVTI